MSILQVNKYSLALSRFITFHVILPDDAPPDMIAGNENYTRGTKTLYLLHGFSGNTTDWLYGSSIQELSLKYNLAVVLLNEWDAKAIHDGYNMVGCNMALDSRKINRQNLHPHSSFCID